MKYHHLCSRKSCFLTSYLQVICFKSSNVHFYLARQMSFNLFRLLSTLHNGGHIDYLEQRGLLPTTTTTTTKTCECATIYYVISGSWEPSDGYVLRYWKCKREASIRKATFFQSSRLSLDVIVELIIYFLMEMGPFG